jgi:hypothetical protein
MRITPQTRYFAGSSRLYAAPSRSNLSASRAVTVLPAAGGLLVALVLSLSLWGAIWLAVSRFGSLWN